MSMTRLINANCRHTHPTYRTTGVGKTRLLSILAHQDRRRGNAVIIVDPKGDTEFLREVTAAYQVQGRLDDFKITPVGFPSISAKFNPLTKERT